MKLDQLKEKDLAPEFFTEESLQTVKNGYLLHDETPRDMYRRVAKSAAKYCGRPELEADFFEIIYKNWLCPSTPILSNSGTDRGLPISCFGCVVPDSVDGIFKSIHEMAMLTKNGGGIGSYWSKIRGRGMSIKGNGKSEGVVPWLAILDRTALAVGQGGVRRAGIQVTIDIDHIDFDEFLRIRRPLGDVNRQCLNLHHAVNITDDFMHKIKSGDKGAREKWVELLKMRLESGEPYIAFIDNANTKNVPDVVKQRKIYHTQLCLSGDTKVLTKEHGAIEISKLVEKDVTIFDGNNWVKNNSFRKTGENKELYRIHFKNGSYVDATSNHRWFLVEQNIPIQTVDLQKGHLIESHNQYHKHQSSEFNLVEKVEKLEGTYDTYCTTVPTTTKFALANGLMTGNCSEIFLPNDEQHTYVCCLSSLNLVKYDEWKNQVMSSGLTVVELSIYFLEGVMQEFIEKARNIPGFENAVRFSEKARALGLGVLGWHSLLQSRGLPFDSFDSMMLNAEIFSKIQKEALSASQKLAKEKGEPEWCSGYGVRHLTQLAIAPTMSNSIIAGGHSAGIEPIAANCYSMKSAKGTFIRKNAALVSLLEKKGLNKVEVWEKIIKDQGSIQSLREFSKEEKEIFKTAREINQFAIINQAAQRQKFIDQGQSLNLFFTPNTSARYIHEVHFHAWESGLKSLYYLRSESVTKGGAIEYSKSDCVSCEG